MRQSRMFLASINVGIRRTTDLSHTSQGTRPADSWSFVLCLDALSVPSHEHRASQLTSERETDDRRSGYG